MSNNATRRKKMVRRCGLVTTKKPTVHFTFWKISFKNNIHYPYTIKFCERISNSFIFFKHAVKELLPFLQFECIFYFKLFCGVLSKPAMRPYGVKENFKKKNAFYYYHYYYHLLLLFTFHYGGKE